MTWLRLIAVLIGGFLVSAWTYANTQPTMHPYTGKPVFEGPLDGLVYLLHGAATLGMFAAGGLLIVVFAVLIKTGIEHTEAS